jgi:hypothetical protein
MHANFHSSLILLVLNPLITLGVQVMELPVKYNFLLPLLTFSPWGQKFPLVTGSHPQTVKSRNNRYREEESNES